MGTLDERVGELERTCSQLKAAVDRMMSALMPDEVAAAQRLAKLIPTNSQLKVWAAECERPEHTGLDHERPW